jgi:hypothetical protein
MFIKDIASAIVKAPSLCYFLEGSPGSGKTYGTYAELKELGYNPIIVSCQNIPVEDTVRLPMADPSKPGTVVYSTPEVWKPVPKMAFILDELFKAPSEVVNAFLPLMWGREFMGYMYISDTPVIVTGNTQSLRLGDLRKPHHINRMTTIRVSEPNQEEAARIMVQIGVDGRIVDWARRNPQSLVSYDESVQAKPQSELAEYWGLDTRNPLAPFCSMRSLEQAGRLVAALSDDPVSLRVMLSGTIGDKAAASYIKYAAKLEDYVSALEVINNPEKVRIPDSPFAQRATSIGLASAANEETIAPIMIYINRCHDEIKKIFARGISRKNSSTLEKMYFKSKNLLSLISNLS